MIIGILEQASIDDLADSQRAYLASLAAHFYGMWEAFATMSNHRGIRSAGKRAGYFCVNDEGQLLQLYVAAPFEAAAAELFAAVVARDEVKGAMVSTADPFFLGLCLDHQKVIRVHTYLYQDHHPGESALAEGTEATFETMQIGELDVIVELQRYSLDQDPGDRLVGYLENMIARRQLYALRLDGEVLATGEVRVSDSQPPFADLGVITMRRHRRRGLAPHVLRRLKQLCYDRDLVPICSTTVENAAAQRAIQKAAVRTLGKVVGAVGVARRRE